MRWPLLRQVTAEVVVPWVSCRQEAKQEIVVRVLGSPFHHQQRRRDLWIPFLQDWWRCNL